jgi:outer membrane protein assembly factor BamB
MAAILACCRDALAVAAWLAAWLAVPSQQPAPEPGETSAEVLWHVTGQARGTPAIFGQRAFFLSKHHDLVTIDIESGRVMWRRATHGPGATTGGTSVIATPTTVIAGDDGLVAFTHAGDERWRFRAEDGGNVGAYLGQNTDHLLIAGSSTGRMWALDTESGVSRWSLDVVKSRRSIVFAPVVSLGMVFAGFRALDRRGPSGLVVVDLASGRELWRRPMSFGGGLVATGADVLVTDQQGRIHAFDRRSGVSRWSLPPADSSSWTPDFRPLALSGPLLIAGSLTGQVTAYDLWTRRERWRRSPIAASIAFGIAADSHAVYVPYLEGQLVALDATDGAERWRTSTDAVGFSWKPLVVAGRLLAGSSSAGFFAFRL